MTHVIHQETLDEIERNLQEALDEFQAAEKTLDEEERVLKADFLAEAERKKKGAIEKELS